MGSGGLCLINPSQTLPRIHSLRIEIAQRYPWDIVGLLHGSKRPLPRKTRRTSEKGFPGPPAPGVKKSSKRVEEWLVFNSLSSFFSPGAERLWEPLFGLFQLPNISTSFHPKMLNMGTPKSKIGIGREIEIQGLCAISTETLGPRTAKVDMLSKGGK